MNKSLFKAALRAFRQYSVPSDLAKEVALILASEAVSLKRTAEQQKIIHQVWRQITK